jgi:transcriptional regulator with XRE-family HTH domain
MELQQIFMANLKKQRKLLGFTQEKLAELCSTDPCYIRQIEIGRRFPSLQYVERIAKALNIAPYRLFFDETNRESTENERLKSLYAEQKQKIKSMLVSSVNQICAVIDEQY